MADSWWQGRIVSLDLETTGVDVEKDRIVTAAVALCGGGLATDKLSLLADPGVEIPESASAVHGVTTERARAEGLPAADVVGVIVDVLARAQGLPLAIFNARFDLTLLDREARRHGVVPLAERRVVHVIDPLVIDKHLDRYRKGSRKLEAICEHYGASLDGAHDAAHDAVAAARLAYALGHRGQVVRRVRGAHDGREKAMLVRQWEAVRGDLDLLHGAQVEWAADQAVGLADHFRGKGQDEDAAGVRTEWPLVPFEARLARAA